MTDLTDTIAIALKYDGGAAPKIIAKDSGRAGADIIELARQYGVPIYEDPVLAQILAQIELNESIPEDLFIIVAEILAFAYLISGQTPPPRKRADTKE